MEYYSVGEARTNIKKILDAADKDQVVFIKRKNVFYKVSLCHNQEQCLEDYYKSEGYQKVYQWKKGE